MFLTILKYASGPVIGCIIGYFTNLIAVKMLFYPRKAVKLFNHSLPFTPGVIPKNKPRLARAIGKAVGENLLTKKDIQEKILGSSIKERITSTVLESLDLETKDLTLRLTALPPSMYEAEKEKLASLLAREIVRSLRDADLENILLRDAPALILDSITNPMVRMFLNESTVSSLMEGAASKIREKIESDGERFITPLVLKKLDEIETKKASALLEDINLNENAVRSIIGSLIDRAVNEGLDKLMEEVDIEKMVEDKINAMDIDELEKLIIQVMKKELNAIINLGAVIGFVLGLLNLLINTLLK